MNFRKFFVFLLLLLSAYSALFSQEKQEDRKKIIPFGNSLSDAVGSSLSKNGFSPVQQHLSETGQDDFADNLLLEFEGDSDIRQNDKSSIQSDKSSIQSDKSSIQKNSHAELDGQSYIGRFDSSSTNFRSTVIFCFTQEDFFIHEEAILDFLKFLQELHKDWTATVLFSALDYSEFRDSFSPKGTEVFALSVDDADSACAVTITLNSSKDAAIHTGSKRHTTPLFLTKRITDSFFEKQIKFTFEDTLSAIYRLGLITSEERLSYFFENNIPAIGLDFNSAENLSVLKDFAQNYTLEGTEEWDMHYIYINRANLFKGIFINEKTIILICLSVGILTILILCVFSFTGKGGERQKYEFIKSSYMLPITVGISFLSLILGQNIVGFFSGYFQFSPVLEFGTKILFSLIFISILFALQEIFKFSVTAFVYGYLLSIVSIFNIFLFATRDLTLFVIFAVEYIIIYVSRSVKKLPVLLIFFFLMTTPFIPYGYVILKNATDAELAASIFCTPLGNLLLAFAMFPFQIMWLKILMFMNIYAGGKGYSMRRIIFNDVISTGVILVFVFTLIFSVSHFIYKGDERAARKIKPKFIDTDAFSLSVSASKDSFSGMDTNHIKILSKEDALKYDVALYGINTEHPIYDSIYDYTVSTENDEKESYSFTIPDFPPKEITIDYASETGTKSRIEITAFYRTDEPHTFRTEKRELKVE